MKHQVEIKIHEESKLKHWFTISVKNAMMTSETKSSRPYQTKESASYSAWKYYHKIYQDTGMKYD